MTDAAMPEQNGSRVTLRDVYTAVGEVETRVVDRIDRLERAMERRADDHSGRIDALSNRVDALEQRQIIEDTRNRDIRHILGDGRTFVLFGISICAFILAAVGLGR